MRRTALLLFAAISLLYLSCPTQNYYWDGIFFSQIIEEDPGGPFYLHPNHLLFNPLGRLFWLGLNALGMNLRALTALQVLSSLTGAATVAVMFCVLTMLEISSYKAVCLSLAFAFSATWWKFATDASSYVPAVLLLMLCVRLLVKRGPPQFVLTGLFHSAAMLLHQLSIFFYPAAVLAFWSRTAGRSLGERFKGIAAYTLAAAVPTAVTYAVAFTFRNNHRTPREFIRWVVSYAPDASFSFAVGKNLATSIVGHVRLVLGGNIRLVVEQRSPVTAVAALALAAIVLILIRRFAQRPPTIVPLQENVRSFMPVFAVWWAVYVLFLLLWLPHNTFYRLFYLPAPFLMAAGFVNGPKTTYNRFALCVAALFLVNFAFYIYPQSRPGTNPSVSIAQEMRGVWKPGDIVYWNVYAADNRTIRYFSPQVEWKELWGRAYINVLEDSLAHSRALWFDSVALADFSRRDPEFAVWLKDYIRIEESYEFPVGDHVVGFTKLTRKD